MERKIPLIEQTPISAGLLVYDDNHNILLVKHKNIFSNCSLSIPKGHIKKGETFLDCAIRETYEETGIRFDKTQINPVPFFYPLIKDCTTSYVAYYVVRLRSCSKLLPNPIDLYEIESADIYSFNYAIQNIEISQTPLLLHIKPQYLDYRILDWHITNGYVRFSSHSTCNLKILTYTTKCKRCGFWNEFTLWCRGIIIENNTILYRPLKKFFIMKDIPELVLNSFLPPYTVSEKIDGTLGILYWIDSVPFIATKGSFHSRQAMIGTRILFTKYCDILKRLNKSYSYFFEIISPLDPHIVEYGGLEDIILLGAYDNKLFRDIRLCELSYLPFKTPDTVETSDYSIYTNQDNHNKEGYVVSDNYNQRIKIKFPTYIKKHETKNKIHNNEI